MQIIIDISKEDYDIIKKSNDLMNWTGHLIKNGTPLPKGHGRLIDADAFGKELHRYIEAPYQYALKVFNEAPTIIEADKN